MTDPPPTNRWAFLRAHGFLVLLLCLLAANVSILVAFGDYGLDRYGNLIGALALLFMHFTVRYTKTGWQRTAMWTFAIAWLGLAVAYVSWQFWLMAR